MKAALKRSLRMIKLGIIRIIIIVFRERGQIWIESESLAHKLKMGWRYEKETELLDHFLSPEDVCLDVGANFGQWSYLMSRRVGSSGKVIAVEPMQISAQIFMRVAKRLKFKNVYLYRLALGDEEREATMQVHEDKYKIKNLSNARILSGPESSSPCFKVQMTTLDSLAEKLGLTKIRLIKCDIEGAEMMFFQGSINVLRNMKPIIICEIYNDHITRYGNKPDDVFNYLRRFGYVPYAYRSGSLVPVDRASAEEINYVFIHESNEHAFCHVNKRKLGKVVYLGSQIGQPKTGGQKYNSKVLGYLERSGFSIEACEVGPYKMPFAFLRVIAINIGYVKRVFPLLEKDTIVIEDVYSNIQTVMLNILMKFRRRGIMVGICHALFMRIEKNIIIRAACYAATLCMLRFFDAIVTVSNSTKRDLVRFGAKEERIYIIPNATDAPQVGKNNYDREEVRILSVGTCYPRKGFHYLIEAVAKLKHLKIKVDIVGDTKANSAYVKRLHSMLSEHGIAHLITIHGYLCGESLWRKFIEADIFVLPSFWESFGIVFLDAMSFELPIISINVGAIPDLVRHEENGLLVKPGDPGALASAIERLAVSPSLRRKLGQDGFRFMQKHPEFTSWDITGERFREVIGSLIGRRACR